MSKRVIVTVTSKGRVLRQYAFETVSLMIGRTAPCEILLDAPGTSRIHAEISREDGGCYVNDLGSANGTFLNGVRQTRAQLQTGDIVQIGDFELHMTITDDEPQRDQLASQSPAAERTIRTQPFTATPPADRDSR